MKIWFATNNAHKKTELEAILDTSLKIPSQEGLDFDPEETGTTFCENALIKAKELKKILKDDGLVIADDSGLCVDALDGRPGIFSARYGEEGGHKLSYYEKNLLLLDELKDSAERSAHFVCAMVLLFENDRFFIVQETLEGEIVKGRESLRGEGGFGYDPVFLIPHLGRTLAELSAEEKNSLSHRGKAGRHIAMILKNFIS
ncbi:MAG: RdgB/HAM1 family non-canonical purine NTP pyrophosphatase [Treponema sp.]|jgi:XTP/dITP diphosphohydrolase|nr:RdgB/HAM1 family non-canonical purine NTP pyrophosphatase [Treponema sp.]